MTASNRAASKVVGRLILVGVIAIALVAPIQGGSLLERGLALLPASCTIGLSGAAVSVTLEGGGSRACDEWVRSDPTNPWYTYTAGTEPDGAVICQQTWKGVTYTVRDQGLLNTYGSTVCSVLSDRATAEILRRVAEGVIADDGDGDSDIDEPYDDAPPIAGDCGFRLVGHDLTVIVYGIGCEGFAYQLPHPAIGWTSFDAVTTDGGPSDGRQICAGYLFDTWVEVIDTGTASFATSVCELVAVPTSPMD